MNDNGVRLQNLRDFTVQIRHTTGTDRTVGTGIVVSPDGKILTCAHVVLAAGINPRLGKPIPSTWTLVVESILGQNSDDLADDGQAEVRVYFPQARGSERKDRRAKIVPAASSTTTTSSCCNSAMARRPWAWSKLPGWAPPNFRKAIPFAVTATAR